MVALIQCQLHLVHFFHSGIGRTLISTKFYRVQDFFGLHVNKNIVTPFMHPDSPLQVIQIQKIERHETQEEQAKYFYQFFLDELPNNNNIITTTPNNTSYVLFSNGRTPSSVYIDGLIETHLVSQFSTLSIEDSFSTTPTDQQLDFEYYVENAQCLHISNLNISDSSTALVIIREPIPSHDLDSYVDSELVNSFGNLTVWDSFNTTPTIQQLDDEHYINSALSQHLENLSILDF